MLRSSRRPLPCARRPEHLDGLVAAEEAYYYDRCEPVQEVVRYVEAEELVQGPDEYERGDYDENGKEKEPEKSV